MTNQEVRVARSIKNGILPKLQEIQRELYMNRFFYMNIDTCLYKKCIDVHIHVATGPEGIHKDKHLCLGSFHFTTYESNELKQRNENEKALRGVRWFIKNWQKRLQA